MMSVPVPKLRSAQDPYLCVLLEQLGNWPEQYSSAFDGLFGLRAVLGLDLPLSSYLQC